LNSCTLSSGEVLQGEHHEGDDPDYGQNEPGTVGEQDLEVLAKRSVLSLRRVDALFGGQKRDDE
jgi:hypothetical protein